MSGSSSGPVGPNPYVGPRPFKYGEELFGRDVEVRELFYMLNAQRIVLLHSPSGAGKSSLVQAGLVPRLQSEQFDVWPTIRVSTEPPPALQANRYVLSTMNSLAEEIPENLRKSANDLSAMTLDHYFETRPRKRSASQNVVLIFDQFEEILTVDPLALDAKRDFFTQLGQLLLRREVWALFAIREDYLAPFDPYVTLVPTQLKNRFRIDLLGVDGATEAIRKPALAAHRQFASGAAEKLVADLATIQVQQADGTFKEENGYVVEPVQLQVVCRRLWDEMPPDDQTIEAEDLKRFGDVNEALGAYYDFSLNHDVAPGDKSLERTIREWFGNHLITSGGIRGQVLQGVDQTEGLDNSVIRGLLSTHLIRAEKRRAATWYELAHDRLLEPVKQSNEKWFKANLEDFQRNAVAWERMGHPDGVLMVGEELEKARRWSREHPGVATPLEQRFLAESDEKEKAMAAQRRKARQVWWLAVGASILAVAALVSFGFAFKEQRVQAALVSELHTKNTDLVKAAAAEKLADQKAEQERLKEEASSLGRTAAETMAKEERRARDIIFRDLLTKVIKFPVTVDANSVPGEVQPLDKDAWTVLVAARDGSPFIIARSYLESGGGRVIAVGHDGFLRYRDKSNTNQMFGTALLWLRGDGPAHALFLTGPRVVLPREAADQDGFTQELEPWGFTASFTPTLTDPAIFNDTGVLVLGNEFGGFEDREIANIVDFVKKGGGLLGIGLGWSWYQMRRGAPIRHMDQYPMNRLLANFGAVWTTKAFLQ